MFGLDDAFIAWLASFAAGATEAAPVVAGLTPEIAAGLTAPSALSAAGAMAPSVAATTEAAALPTLANTAAQEALAQTAVANSGGITGSIAPTSYSLANGAGTTSLGPTGTTSLAPSSSSYIPQGLTTPAATPSPYSLSAPYAGAPGMLDPATQATVAKASTAAAAAPAQSGGFLDSMGNWIMKDPKNAMLAGSVGLMGLSALKGNGGKSARDHAKPYDRKFDPNMGIYPSMSGMGLGFAKGGGIASVDPGMDSFSSKKIAAIRQRYRSKADAIADLNDPNSAIVKAGVYNADDPLLEQAFGYTSRQGKPVQKGPQYMAGGGIAGDGMSDSIPATIEGRAPARLAANEYVVPADVVSHLGNGSSDAGAQQMNSMVARIRKARTGSTKQAPKINPKRFMP